MKMKRSTTPGTMRPFGLLLALALGGGVALLVWMINPEPPPAPSPEAVTGPAAGKRGPAAQGLPREAESLAEKEALRPKAEQSLRWAERLLKKVPPLPPRETEYLGSFFPRLRLGEAEEAFQRVIGKYGGTARAYVGRGECQLRMGEYAAAVHSFGQALKLSPSDAAAQAGYCKARQLSNVAQAVGPLLPRGHQVVSLEELTVRRSKTLWAVLSAQVGDVRSDIFPFSDVRLTLFQESPQGYRKVWQSGRLRDPRLGLEGDLSDVQLYVLDLTGDGVSEVVVWKLFMGASWMPSHVDVFAWRGHRLVKILGVSSSEPIWIEDLHHDGRYEIGNYYEIGLDLAHCEQPLWTDIYAYRQRQYVLANADFPQEFQGWVQCLREGLQEYPGDPELLKYLGLAHEIEGHPRAALAAYRYAEKACRDRFKKKPDTELEWLRRDLQSRIRRLSRRVR